VIQSYAQVAIGVAVVAYGLYQLAKQVGLPRLPRKAAAVPTDDVRIVSDLATRLRSQSKTPAVKIALDLIAELLKPEESKA
jgi:hypothetical protein